MAKDLRFSLLLAYYGGLLPPKQNEMLTAYYDMDLSLSEIAENEGLTRQGVHDAIKRAEQQLSGYEEELGLIKKANDLKRFAAEIPKTPLTEKLLDYIETL